MKKIITILIMMIWGLGFGQGEIKDQLPVLSPQTPTTAGLGKYGEVQVNESTGLISPSIPLFEYYAGKMNLPISLSYNGNGVKVNQSPTWVGINWNLNPGGVITRVVKDKQDETVPNYRDFSTDAQLDILPGAYNCQTQLSPWFLKLTALNSSLVDTEVDIFNYNFMGYSGSFFIDTENVAHLIKFDKELLISFHYNSGNKSEIVIKTPEGDTFFFGGANASESSRSFVSAGAGSGSTQNAPFTQNAFYLYKTSFLTGGSIYFDYEPNVNSGCFNKIGIQESASYLNTVPRGPCLASSRDLLEQVESSIQLKKIRSSFNNQYVEFETSTVNSCAGLYKLNNVYLKDVNNAIIKKVNLEYLTLNVEPILNVTKNKYFLQKVKFYKSNLQFENEYEMTYKTPSFLPKKDSFAQDELGNYNGITTNTSLIMLCPTFANREAIPEMAIIGSLEKIEYPTGGYSTFEYELPFKGYSYLYQPNNLSLFYRLQPNNTSSPHTVGNNTYNVYTNGVFSPDQGDGPLITTMPSNVTVDVNTTVNGSYSHPIYLKIKAINSNGIVLTQIFTIPTSTGYVNQNFNHSHTFNLPTGNYTFQYSMELHFADGHNYNSSSQNSQNSVVTSATLNLPNLIKTNYYPGLRIKKIESIDNNGNIEKTRYYYNTYANRFNESYVFNPNYTYLTHKINTSNSIANDAIVEVVNVTSNSVKNLFFNDLGVYIYENITVSYGGDNFEKGSKELHFYKVSTSPIFKYASISSVVELSGLRYVDCDFNGDYKYFIDIGVNDSFQNSILQNETFRNHNGDILKTTKYNYSQVLDTEINNIKVFTYNPQTNGNLYLMYGTKSFKYRKTTTETKEYFNNSTTPVVNTITNLFNNPDKVSLPSSIETTNSSGVVKKINLFYPSDVLSIGNLNPVDINNLNTLQNNKHNLAEIVKTESLLNGNLLESKQVHFKNFGSNMLPNIIKTKKGNDPLTVLDERVQFENYNVYGKPTLVSMKNGMKIAYFYNSKQQVIMKIENADPEIELNDGVSSSNPCYFQEMYPQSMVTNYEYDPLTNNLIRLTDPKCDKITYTYDSFGRLEFVKDKNGNILSENEYHFKP